MPVTLSNPLDLTHFDALPYRTVSKYTPVYKNALAIQRIAYGHAIDPSTEPSLLCQLSKCFADMETLKLRLRMKPAPKPIDTTKLTKRVNKAKTPDFTE